MTQVSPGEDKNGSGCGAIFILKNVAKRRCKGHGAALRACAWEQQRSQLAWIKAGRALMKGDQAFAFRLAEMAKKHSSEAFYALDDPLEAAVFFVLVKADEGDGNKG